MSIFEAIILGIVQGITEFLPVSSSGHLQIVKAMMGVELSENLTFDVALHAGTVLSTIVVLWGEVRKLFTGFFSRGHKQEKNYVYKILISAIPVAIVGFTMRDKLEQLLGSQYIMLVVAGALLLTAALLAFAQYARTRSRESVGWLDAIVMGVAGALLFTAALLAFAQYARTRSRESVGWLDSVVMGVAQAVAVMPGISRSGATIATGILMGVRKEKVAQFSFLMVLIPILGDTFLTIIKGEAAWGTIGFWPLLSGFLAAFIVGALACKFMIEMIRRGKLIYFAIYCLFASTLALSLYFWS